MEQAEDRIEGEFLGGSEANHQRFLKPTRDRIRPGQELGKANLVNSPCLIIG